MIKSNGKLLQIPKLFELRNMHAFDKEKCLNLEIMINSIKSVTKIDFSCLWSLKKDFYEIDVPLINNSNNLNLNISACLKYEAEYLFAYSTHEVVSIVSNLCSEK